MSVEQHDRFQEDVGAYLLGALERGMREVSADMRRRLRR